MIPLGESVQGEDTFDDDRSGRSIRIGDDGVEPGGGTPWTKILMPRPFAPSVPAFLHTGDPLNAGGKRIAGCQSNHDAKTTGPT